MFKSGHSSQNVLSHISYWVTHKDEVIILMYGSRLYLKCQSYHPYLLHSTLQFHGISWAKCEDLKVYLNYILLYFWTNCLLWRIKHSSNPGQKKKFFFTEHLVCAGKILSHLIFIVINNPDTVDNILHFIEWEIEGTKE